MNRKRWTVLTVGWGFILLGIAGVILPILPGLVFLAAGLIVLSTEYVWARNLLNRLTSRFPRFAAYMDSATVKAQAWLGRARTDTAP